MLCGIGICLIVFVCLFVFFFFQAEDGIRDLTVTGVQTCALPIWLRGVIDRMKSLEYHVGGQPVRVIVDGVPSPQGRTQAQKAAAFARHADRYRRGLVRAPRGHVDMLAVLLTEPSSAQAHAGLVFLDSAGCPRFAMPGVMAAAAAAVSHGLMSTGEGGAGGTRLVLDTPAGAVTAHVEAETHGTSVRV